NRRITRTVAQVGVRFGWNRHGLGQTVGQHRRLRARRVVLPGSVIVLESPLPDVESKLLEGLGSGREQGFGGLLPHPGIASSRLLPNVAPPTLRSRDEAGRIAAELWDASHGRAGPSSSQIGHLAQLTRKDPERALTYVAKQGDRPPRIWELWKPVHHRIGELIAKDPALAARVLRGWQDLAAAAR